MNSSYLNKNTTLLNKRCAIFGTQSYENDETKRNELLAEIHSAINDAINDGYTTFLTSCNRGTELDAAKYILKLKTEQSEKNIILVIVIPYYNYMPNNNRILPIYNYVFENADYIYNTSNVYSENAEKIRDAWIVKHCRRVITIRKAPLIRLKGLEDLIEENIIVPKPKEKVVKKKAKEKDHYPINFLKEIFPNGEVDYNSISEMNIQIALGNLTERQRKTFLERYKEQKTLEQIGNEYGRTRERIRQVQKQCIRKLKSKRNRSILLGISEPEDNSKLYAQFNNWTINSVAVPEKPDLQSETEQNEKYAIDFTLKNNSTQSCRYKNDPPNGHQPWSEKEENELIEQFNSGLNLNEIALLHKRTKNAIEARCKKIGLME